MIGADLTGGPGLKGGSGLPATLRAARPVGEATCHRHCDRPSHATEITSGLPRLW